MKKNKKVVDASFDDMIEEDVALFLACMLGHQQSNNHAGSVVRSAEIFKELTGQDVGISELQKAEVEINGKKTLWQRIKSIFK
jgi:hypothetical protein